MISSWPSNSAISLLFSSSCFSLQMAASREFFFSQPCTISKSLTNICLSFFFISETSLLGRTPNSTTVCWMGFLSDSFRILLTETKLFSSCWNTMFASISSSKLKLISIIFLSLQSSRISQATRTCTFPLPLILSSFSEGVGSLMSKIVEVWRAGKSSASISDSFSMIFHEALIGMEFLLTILQLWNLKSPLCWTAARVAPRAIVSLELVVLDGFIWKMSLMIEMTSGILDPPPTSQTESMGSSSLEIYSFKSSRRVLISSKTELASAFMESLEIGSLMSQSSIRHSMTMSVSLMPVRILRCFWMISMSLRQAFLFSFRSKPVFCLKTAASLSKTFMSMSLQPRFRLCFSARISMLVSVNLTREADSLECPKSMNKTFFPSPISFFLNPPQSRPVAIASLTNLTFLRSAISAAARTAFFSACVKQEGTEITIIFQSRPLCWMMLDSWEKQLPRICSGTNLSEVPLQLSLNLRSLPSKTVGQKVNASSFCAPSVPSWRFRYRRGETREFLKLDLSLTFPDSPILRSPSPQPTTDGVSLKLASLVTISMAPRWTAAILVVDAPRSIPMTVGVDLVFIEVFGVFYIQQEEPKLNTLSIIPELTGKFWYTLEKYPIQLHPIAPLLGIQAPAFHLFNSVRKQPTFGLQPLLINKKFKFWAHQPNHLGDESHYSIESQQCIGVI